MPNISGNIVTFDRVYDLLLVHTTTKWEDVIVFECTETYSGSRNSHRVNLLPLVLLSIVLFAIAINRIIDVSTYNIYKSIQTNYWMVSVLMVHVSYLFQRIEHFVVVVTCVQIQISMLNVPTNQINLSWLSCDWSWVEGNFVRHLYLLFIKVSCSNLIDLTASLVPLKAVQTMMNLISEWSFGIVINSQILFYHVLEIFQYRVWIFIKQHFKFWHFFIVIGILRNLIW